MREFDMGRGLHAVVASCGGSLSIKGFECAGTAGSYAVALFRYGCCASIKFLGSEAEGVAYVRDLYPGAEEVTHG